jgi:hypothetical protein
VEKAPDFKDALGVLKQKISRKFRILVMVDLGGTIFLRTDAKGIDQPESFKIAKYRYFKRPGYETFIKRLSSHPRCLLCFYTSITRKNVTPILHKVLPEELLEKVGIFDQEYCSRMAEDKYYSELMKDPWDTYRDLDKVFSHKFCVDNQINLSNALLVDSDPRKVQLFLANSITSEEYCKEDVNGEAREFKGESTVRDAEW